MPAARLWVSEPRTASPCQTGLQPGAGWGRRGTPWTPASCVFPGRQIPQWAVSVLKRKYTFSVVNPRRPPPFPRGGRRRLRIDRSRAPLDGGDTSGAPGGQAIPSCERARRWHGHPHPRAAWAGLSPLGSRPARPLLNRMTRDWIPRGGWGTVPSRVAVDAGGAPPAFPARVAEVGRAHPTMGGRAARQPPKPADRLPRHRASRAVLDRVLRFRVTSCVAGHTHGSHTSPCDTRCRSVTGTFQLRHSLGGPPVVPSFARTS